MKKILIIRNDKLGDFVLSLPSYAFAKKNLPDTQIHTLVPNYTRPLAESFQWIDKIIVDPGKDAGLKKNYLLLKQIRSEKYDAVITLFSTTRIGIITKLVGIPFRLAPATKFAQIFYNYKLTQRRSRSEKPEYIYNLDLVKYFFEKQSIKITQDLTTPYLKFSEHEVEELRKNFIQKNSIAKGHKLVFIHAGSGGSANNLSIEQYSILAKKLNSQSGHTIVITAGPGEGDVATLFSSKLHNIPHVIFNSTNGLINYCKHIQFADLFIAGSTGPLHIAGALDIPTVGFYTRRRSATALRWQTLNSDHKRLAFSPEKDSEVEDMSSINLDIAVKEINKKFLNYTN